MEPDSFTLVDFFALLGSSACLDALASLSRPARALGVAAFGLT